MHLGNSIITGGITSAATAAAGRSASPPGPRTSFNFTRTLDAAVDYFRVQVRNINHDSNVTADDNDPKVILSNFQVKINGVADSSFNFVSNKMSNDPSTYFFPTFYSSTSIGAEDSMFQSFNINSAITIYQDLTVSAGAANATITLSGNVSVTDGSSTGLEYSPVNGWQGGIFQFEFNNVSNSKDRMQVFIYPDVQSSVLSGTGTATKTIVS